MANTNTETSPTGQTRYKFSLGGTCGLEVCLSTAIDA
jgi:hypothetical protein